MATMDVPSELKLAQLRKQNLRKTFEEVQSHSSSILFLAIQWKDMESHFDSIEKLMSKRQEELASLEGSLRKRLEDVKLREAGAESVQESVNKRLGEVELREANEKLAFQERAKELDSMRASVEERSREVELLRTMVAKGTNALDLKEKRLGMLEKSTLERSNELEAVQKSIKESFREIELKERGLGLVEESVEERVKVIELREKRLEKWSKEIKLEEKQFSDVVKEVELKENRLQERFVEVERKEKMVKERAEELDMKEMRFEEWAKTIDLKEKRVEVSNGEVELKEKSLQERSVEVERKEKMVKERAEELDMKEMRFEEWAKTIDLKEKRVEVSNGEVELKEKRLLEQSVEVEQKEKMVKERAEELDMKEMRFEEWAKTIDLKEKRVEVRNGEVELKEKIVTSRAEKLEVKEMQFDLRAKAFDLKEKRLEERSMDIEECTKGNNLKEKILEERSMEIELKEKGLAERSREIELKQNMLEQRLKEVGLKEKQFEQCSQGVETKEKRFNEIVNYDVKSEACETFEGNNAIANSASKNAGLSEEMDGKSLQMFLNKHYKEHHLMHDEVSAALRVSSDPGKLVLDAVQGFYPLDDENANPSIELSVIRKSCILILEGLMRLSPEIKLNVKSEAINLAIDWKTKMRAKAEDHMEALGFLLLLAAYRLAWAFDNDEHVTHLLVVAQDRLAPELCRSLGLVDKISDFIRNLITEKKDIDAIRLVYAFKLVGELQPVKLLKTYLKKSKRASRRMGGNSPAEQIKALNKRIADVKAVMRCIEEHNLESEYSPKNLQKFIAELNKKAILIRISSTPSPRPQAHKHCKKKCKLPAADVPHLTSAPSSGCTSNIQLQQPRRIKRPRTAVSAARDLDACPGDNSSNRSMQFPHQQPSGYNTGQVSSINSAQAEIKQTKSENFQENDQEDWNMSFEQLMFVPLEMKACRKEAAMNFAANMKFKLDAKIENPVDVLRFLQLIANYELGSSFDADELHGLFEYIYHHKLAPKLYLALGLVDKIPKFIQNLVAEDKWLDAFKYVSAYGLKDKLPLVPLLKSYLNYSKKVAEKRWKESNNSPESLLWAINKELSASMTVLNHIVDYNLENEYPPEILENRIVQLEKEKKDLQNAINFKDGFGPGSSFNPKVQQKSEKHIPPTTAIAVTNALTPSPAHAPNSQSQQLSGNKRPRMLESTETAQNDFVGAIATIPLEQKPPQPDASLHNNHASQNFTRHYSLGGFPPMNQHIGSYPNAPISYYPRDALNPGHFNRPVANGCPSQMLNQPGYYYQVSFGGYGDGYRGPYFHNGQAPSGGYGLPPQYHPSFHP